MKCGEETEVYSRVVGYHRPVRNWNRGKREEWKERKVFSLERIFGGGDSAAKDELEVKSEKLGIENGNAMKARDEG